MTLTLRLISLSVAMLATPAMADSDSHAQHHVAGQPPASGEAPGAEASAGAPCKMMGLQAPSVGGTQPMGGMPTHGSPDKGMMSGGMSSEMKKCMADHTAARADHAHGN